MTDTKIENLGDLYKALSTQLAEGTKANAEKIAALEAQIVEVKSAQALQTKTDERPDTRIGYKATGNPDKDFSWLRFFDGVMDEWHSDRTKKMPEYELTMEATTKAQMAGIDTAGGFLVAPEIFIDQIIPALEPRVVAIASGATMVTDLVGSPVEWPRWDDTLEGFWTGEYEDATEDQLKASQISLAPKGLASMVELTQRLIRQTSGKVEMAVRDALARGLARTLDKAIFKGTGGKQPVGILSQKNVGTVDVTAGSYTMTSGAGQEAASFLEDMIGKLEDADALMGKPVWFMHPHTRRWFHKFRDSTGRPLFFEYGAAPTSSTVRTATFYGYPYASTTNLVGNNSDADLVYANVEEILVGQWGGLLVEADSSLGFKKGTKWLKASMEVDVGLEHGQSVANALNLDTTTDP